MTREELKARREEIMRVERERIALMQPKPLTPEEEALRAKKREINRLKHKLFATDWIVVKIAESEDAEEIALLRSKYESILAERKTWRARINSIEEELK